MHRSRLFALPAVLLVLAETSEIRGAGDRSEVKPKTTTKSTATARRAPAAKPKYDGKWSGTTAQGHPIHFTVTAGKITDFEAEGRLEGPGCSTTSKVTTNLGAPITGGTASGSVRSGPGGVSLTFRANFTTAARAEGPVSFELHPIPGPPPGVPGHVPSCAAYLDTMWTATKEGAAAAELAQAAPPKRTGACRVPTTDAFQEEPAEETQLPGTTRFYLSTSGRYLTAGPPSTAVASGLETLEYQRTLIGDIQGTTYRFGLFLRSNDPRRSSVVSDNDPPGKLSAEIILRRKTDDTVLASATFTTGPKDRRHLAVVNGPDPETVQDDKLVVRTKWLEGSNTVYADSWVEVPQTVIKESEVDRQNATWTLTGQVLAADGRPQAGKRVMFSPLDAGGSPAKLYWGDAEGGRIPLRNPRRTTDSAGRFQIQLPRVFFSRGGGQALAGEAVAVEDCEGSEPRPIGVPVRFTLTDEERTVDLGTLRIGPV